MKRIFALTLLSIAVSPLVLSQSEQQVGQNEPGNNIRELNQRFGEAQVRRDVAELNRMLTDDFSLVNPAGKTLNRSQFLTDMNSGDLKYESLNYEDVSVRVFSGCALLTGRVVRKGQYKGQDNSGQFRFVHIFVTAQGSSWRILFAQATRIAE